MDFQSRGYPVETSRGTLIANQPLTNCCVRAEVNMLRGLFGPDTTTYMLRGSLEETSATHRGIAARVASASGASTNGGFADQLAAAQAATGDVDLQREMAALADTQLRYEAEAKLLQAAYARLRTAVRDRA